MFAYVFISKTFVGVSKICYQGRFPRYLVLKKSIGCACVRGFNVV